jgi:hypothetical protein
MVYNTDLNAARARRVVGDGGVGEDTDIWQDNRPRLHRSLDGGHESFEHRLARRKCSREEERGPEALSLAGDSSMMASINLEK